jgi:acetoin utilization deacetylase AcuC-like enzyme
MLGFCTSPEFVRHQTGAGHPERPERIAAIFQAVREAGLVESPNPVENLHLDFGEFAPAGFRVRELTPRPAEITEIRYIHPQKYIDNIRSACRSAGVLDQDTPVGPESFDVALLSCGALLTCCDAVVSGEVKRAFTAVRPPGHHAEPSISMGFCLFANVAIAARYLQHRHGIGKIAIVDFDVHHGNGTQAAFETDPSVLFISLHQSPTTCYPGTGFAEETGCGNILNIPMDPFTGDAEYLKAMDEKVLPRIDEFKPDFILLSAGFDAHIDDPLASIRVTEEGFGQITQRLVASAKKHCDGKIVSALEGGYNLIALGRSVVRHLIELI